MEDCYEKSIIKASAQRNFRGVWEIFSYFSVYGGDDRLCIRLFSGIRQYAENLSGEL